ncbi:MAG: RdgB/HAM1 family non-canonical purine NTP pyrophosphatase [Nitrososphaerota archaeon]|jgi:XTP/dITP diphosphohydrolase|nr:RdgB/HAM1 family non-canonical purine NTP pyrophosphatase [Nitrososphaerota archaeon]MDG6948924.1 RdgB/HAM1 family non-canonical purine NTP pyrophosphatase [Nitrososphaerota archaeon]
MKPAVCFATSNDGKFNEAVDILKPYGIVVKRLPAKGTEIQSERVTDIAVRAAAETYSLEKKPIIAEDTGLYVHKLDGFPGPYAAYALKTIGPDGLLRLLKGKKRGAHFETSLAYVDGSSIIEFTGTLEGTISSKQRGSNGFGYDPIFVPSGYRMTLAEMTREEKNKVSHRSQAFTAFGRWYAKRIP